MQKNCPNYAAPYELSLNKCPYCGTSYCDLSALDLAVCEPFYLKIKTLIGGKVCYITQLVRPNTGISMEFSSNNTYCYGGKGEKLIAWQSMPTVTTSLSFEAVPDKNGRLYLVKEEGKDERKCQ